MPEIDLVKCWVSVVWKPTVNLTPHARAREGLMVKA
jgi:hypothetical protein